jgi:hypothetical protein
VPRVEIAHELGKQRLVMLSVMAPVVLLTSRMRATSVAQLTQTTITRLGHPGAQVVVYEIANGLLLAVTRHAVVPAENQSLRPLTSVAAPRMAPTSTRSGLHGARLVVQ